MASAEPEVTPLGRRIAALVAANGPLSIADYMQLCLADPRHGYYRRREAIGAAGDFVTAPQISPLFGGIVGVWCLAAWQALGRPARIVLAEAGPGLGTLMSDLLRATRPIAGFHAALDIHLIETSPAMRARQAGLLAAWQGRIGWCESLAGLPDGPLLLVANEFLDALPFRQYVRQGDIWRERGVGIDADGGLAYAPCAAILDPDRLPLDHRQAPDGAIFECSPAREAFVAETVERLGRDAGFALWIDYGHAESAFGDTFQAVRDHHYADPLAEPGMADLTSHVDFAALARTAENGGAMVSPIVTQARLLFDLGLRERVAMLRPRATVAQRETMDVAIERLTGNRAMGKLFKAMALGVGATPDFPPFASAPAG